MPGCCDKLFKMQQNKPFSNQKVERILKKQKGFAEKKFEMR